MADGVSVKVDANRALLKFERVPTTVRDQLRVAIPSLTNQLAAVVDANLASGLKSRTRLQTKREMHETPREIYGKVAVVWTGDSKQKMVPNVLESGSVGHPIAAVNAQALAFFWRGADRFYKAVWHPEYFGIQYMERAFNQMRPQIVADLRAAAKKGASEAKP